VSLKVLLFRGAILEFWDTREYILCYLSLTLFDLNGKLMDVIIKDKPMDVIIKETNQGQGAEGPPPSCFSGAFLQTHGSWDVGLPILPKT